MSDVDDFEDWKYDSFHSDEPDEPEGCWHPRSRWCYWCEPRFGRKHRQDARRWRQQRQRWRKIQRHANDRFWRARNPTVFDEAPF